MLGVDIIGTLNGDVIYDLIPEALSLIDALMLQRARVGKWGCGNGVDNDGEGGGWHRGREK